MDQAIELAKQADSAIIILLIIVAIVSVPVLKTLAGISSSKRKQDYEREGRLIQVIEKNTEVNSALKTLIEADKTHCESCKQEQFSMFRKVFDNQEIANVKLAEISKALEINKGEI